MKTLSADILTLKLAVLALISQAFDVYSGAIAIALISAAMRSVYSAENCSDGDCPLCCRFWLFTRSFILSAGVTMLMVHAGKLQGWSSDMTIIISGVAGFMSKELIDVCMTVIPARFKAFVRGGAK